MPNLEVVFPRSLGRVHMPPRERLSDSWPDFAAELPDANIKDSAWKNRVGQVLGEALGAVVYSVGLVVLLIVVLELLDRG